MNTIVARWIGVVELSVRARGGEEACGVLTSASEDG